MKNLEYLVGKVVQLSYLVDTKHERQYSANYINIFKDAVDWLFRKLVSSNMAKRIQFKKCNSIQTN